jgi:hypothetical protein
MSFFVFALIFAFIVWQRLNKSRRPGKLVQSEAARPASPSTAFTNDAPVEDVAADVAGLVSDFFGQNGQDLIKQAVNRAISESRTGAGRRLAVAIEPIEQAIQAKRTQPREKQRAKYLLDGDGGYRQRTDRTARLQQQFGGKGLCSPRHSGPAKARQTNR